MVFPGKYPVAVNIALTLTCATALAILAILHSPGTTGLIAVVFVLLLFLSQLSLARYHSIHQRRSDRYHRLGRKLHKLKRSKTRDESAAIKVLNHIVNQARQDAGPTQIWQLPLENFTGDLALSITTEDGRCYTLLADLTGHGIAAAMGATPVASIFQATARRGLSVEEIVVELNNKLTALLPPGFFCCVAVAMCRNGLLRVCNAGLPTLLIADSAGNIAHRINSDQLPLGIEQLHVDDVPIYTKTYNTPHQLYAYTDGLIEAKNGQGKVFEQQYLESLIANPITEEGRIQHIRMHFEGFVKGTALSDDISIVEVNI